MVTLMERDDMPAATFPLLDEILAHHLQRSIASDPQLTR
ncbi:hypothetical protein X744_29845 [Mesorhizobium sp. LNJC372A00]|nr:hypothetical protein X745_31010 [Mesorhizobium sp. LNJC374B00]ESY52314.1 hypothetical protein X744_29845 [Mesorhizobium sp. LNJC372A00]